MDPANYFGATIFWLYNVAALFFTGIVISTILGLKRQRDNDKKTSKANNASTLFTGLACFSFATLSFNMLHVLIQSFNLWTQRYPTAIEDGYVQAIWQWSITSTLFRDFGEAIVADDVRYLWTEGELLVTLGVCLYMGIKGWC